MPSMSKIWLSFPKTIAREVDLVFSQCGYNYPCWFYSLYNETSWTRLQWCRWCYEARDVVHGVNANYNEKFAKRKVSLSTGAEASTNVILPLHRFYFFNSFFDQIAPNGEVSFDMNFESDANVLFTAAGLDVGRFVLPKMIFNALSEQISLDQYLKPHISKKESRFH